MPALASLSQADLDALAAEQAAQDPTATAPVPAPYDPAQDPNAVYTSQPAALAPVPPPYDPAQDTQGMQAQPNYIAPAPPQAAAPILGSGGGDIAPPAYVDAGPAPEYREQTSFPAPPSNGYDEQVPFPGSAGRPPELPTDRIRRRVGNVQSWFDTPTTPGAIGAPPPDNPQRGQTNLLGGLAGAAKFYQTYGPGSGGNLGQTVATNFAPWSPEVAQNIKDTMIPGGAKEFPAPLKWATALGRYLWYNNINGTQYSQNVDGSGYNPMDTTDAYLGNDPEYLNYMASMPEYLTPLRPLVARAAHGVAQLPGIPWQPPYIPGMEPAAQPDPVAPGAAREHRLSPEPGVYYDDPYIPGPDKRRKRIA